MKVKSEGEVAQSCPTLSNPMDYSLPGSSVHGIFQARVLKWGAIVLIGVLHSIDFSSLFLYGLRKLQKYVLQTSEISTGFPMSNIYLCDV